MQTIFNKLTVACIGIFSALTVAGQSFSPSELTQGYSQRKDTTWFVFDPKLYEKTPTRVVVTGSFRNWDTGMDQAQWTLKQTGNQWAAFVLNPKFAVISVASEFKFRIDNGLWLDPPAQSPNISGGNLVYMKGLQAPNLEATMLQNGNIWATVSGHAIERPLNKEAYKLSLAATGEFIPLQAVTPNTGSKTLLVPAKTLDIRRVYQLEIPGLDLKTLVNFDGWFSTLYSEKELGANIAPDGKSTWFRLFAPRATKVKLYLYRKDSDKDAFADYELTKDSQGVWEKNLPENLDKVWYDFTVHGFDDPGNGFFEQTGKHIGDPYARVSDDSFGKCRVWQKTKPGAALKKGIPALEDVIAYEVHVQDFTDLLPVDANLKGTIPAMTVSGLKNSLGQPIGYDYLKSLGFHTLLLMPVQEYLHYSDEEWQAAFKNDAYMKEQGINMENYQWGYRTTHAMAIETRYRKRDTEKGAQREQFRDMVQTFHNDGMAVIVDLVFNHTAEHMDGRKFLFNFAGIDPLYYYRSTKENKIMGEYGNEPKTENRPMTQRWIIDQCLHLIQEFGVDGFRIDLGGLTDKQTLKALREAVGPNIIIYGEPWIASSDPAVRSNPDWSWYKKDAPICFFNDDARNAFKGPTANPENKATDRGFAGGNGSERTNVMKALTSKTTDEATPVSSIKYLDIHDNWALADQFATKDWDGRFGVDENAFKLAAVLLFTSTGPIVLHGGTEMMRSKGLGPLKEVVKETRTGKVYLHGKRDTYNLRFANHFVWENVGKKKGDKNSFCNYGTMLDFWKSLLAFRNSAVGKIFRRAEVCPDGFYHWYVTANQQLLGYRVNDKVLVLMNVSEKPGHFDWVSLPKGNWKLVGNLNGVDLKKPKKGKYAVLKGGEEGHKVDLPAQSFMMWVKE